MVMCTQLRDEVGESQLDSAMREERKGLLEVLDDECERKGWKPWNRTRRVVYHDEAKTIRIAVVYGASLCCFWNGDVSEHVWQRRGPKMESDECLQADSAGTGQTGCVDIASLLQGLLLGARHQGHCLFQH